MTTSCCDVSCGCRESERNKINRMRLLLLDAARVIAGEVEPSRWDRYRLVQRLLRIGS